MTSSDLPPLPPGFLVEPVPNDSAIAWLRNKPAVASSVFNRLLPELKARAIAIAGVESASIARDVREAIASVPAGADWDKEKRKIADLLHPYLADPDEPKSKKPARRRAELLLRTHGFQAYAIGQHEVMREQEAVFPWWQYLTMGDELVRPTHSALNKLILPANSPFWLRHSPPWDWGCRCRKVPLLPEEVDEIRDREAAKPPESKTVIEGNALSYLEQQNKLDRGPSKIFDMTPPSEKGRAGAFLFEPDSLRLQPAQLQTRYDPQTWADFVTWSQATTLEGPGSRTVWEWMGGAPAPVPVPAVVGSAPVAVPRFKTASEAARWITQTHGIQANLKGMDAENCIAMAEAVTDQVGLYGDAVKSLGFIGSRQGYLAEATKLLTSEAEQAADRYGYHSGELREKFVAQFIRRRAVGIQRDAIAWYIPADRALKTSLIVVEGKGYKAQAMRRFAEISRKSGFTISGEDERGLAQSSFIHEIGHHVDRVVDARNDPEIVSYWQSLTSVDIDAGLSRYATKNLAEVIAESWAEVHVSAQPRPIASKVAGRIQTLLIKPTP